MNYTVVLSTPIALKEWSVLSNKKEIGVHEQKYLQDVIEIIGIIFCTIEERKYNSSLPIFLICHLLAFTSKPNDICKISGSQTLKIPMCQI